MTKINFARASLAGRSSRRPGRRTDLRFMVDFQ
jgi:hypothetical protein